MVRPSTTCTNLNHRRSWVPIRCCPMCGEVVNQAIPITIQRCTDEAHAIQRHQTNNYCTGCGLRLRK